MLLSVRGNVRVRCKKKKQNARTRERSIMQSANSTAHKTHTTRHQNDTTTLIIQLNSFAHSIYTSTQHISFTHTHTHTHSAAQNRERRERATTVRPVELERVLVVVVVVELQRVRLSSRRSVRSPWGGQQGRETLAHPWVR